MFREAALSRNLNETFFLWLLFKAILLVLYLLLQIALINSRASM